MVFGAFWHGARCLRAVFDKEKYLKVGAVWSRLGRAPGGWRDKGGPQAYAETPPRGAEDGSLPAKGWVGFRVSMWRTPWPFAQLPPRLGGLFWDSP